jgi:hypothetical protein
MSVSRSLGEKNETGSRRVEPKVEAKSLELKARGDGIPEIGRKLGIGASVAQRVFKHEQVPMPTVSLRHCGSVTGPWWSAMGRLSHRTPAWNLTKDGAAAAPGVSATRT